jgi:hypothetical protein
MFEIKLEMPSLRAVEFRVPTQRYVADYEAHIRVINRGPYLVRRREMTAYSDKIATKPNRAVRKSFHVRLPYIGFLAELQLPKAL